MSPPGGGALTHRIVKMSVSRTRYSIFKQIQVLRPMVSAFVPSGPFPTKWLSRCSVVHIWYPSFLKMLSHRGAVLENAIPSRLSHVFCIPRWSLLGVSLLPWGVPGASEAPPRDPKAGRGGGRGGKRRRARGRKRKRSRTRATETYGPGISSMSFPFLFRYQ